MTEAEELATLKAKVRRLLEAKDRSIYCAIGCPCKERERQAAIDAAIEALR